MSANPLNSNTLYVSNYNNQVYVSRTRGYTWTTLGNPITGGGIIKAIAVNPLDTTQLLCGMKGGSGDRVMKTTNSGVTWSQKWGGVYSYFGKPMEFKPNHPDTVYTMGSDTVFRSTDFGSSWSVMKIAPGFDAWCDAEVRPDSGNIMFVGDYTTGIWKTTDYGSTWKKVYATAGDGEIPCIAIDPFNPRVAYASKYSGGGGLLKSTDGGETWNCLNTPIKPCVNMFGGNGWWVTCSQGSRGYVYFGTYGANPNGVFISRDSGATWTNYVSGFQLVPINYGLLTVDTLTVLALQDDGLYKLQYPVSLQMISPNGGEFWDKLSTHDITWSAAGLYKVKLEYSTNRGSTWVTISDTLPAWPSSYAWTLPFASSDSCRVRITDAMFTSTADTSDSDFTIFNNPITVQSPNGGEHWDAGSTHQILWTAAPIFPSVNVSYSVDSGSSWTLIANRPTISGSVSWQVPRIVSDRCLIRVAGGTDSTVFDLPDTVFSIGISSSFTALLHLRDQGSGEDSVRFGTASGATDGIDTAFGESELTPKPSPGTFDIRWRIGATNGTRTDIRDTLSNSNNEHLFIGEFQPGPSGSPCTLSWNPESLRTEYFILRDTVTHGQQFRLDMRRHNSLMIDSAGAFEVLECQPVTIQLSFADDGWHLVSVPVLVGDYAKASILPYCNSQVFRYSAGYLPTDPLSNGPGFWVKGAAVTFTGCPLSVDTGLIAAGWNMVGSISASVPTSSLVSIPPGIIISSYFGFGPSGYTVTPTIQPGYGYWVKSSSAGKLVFSSSAAVLARQDEELSVPSGLHTLTIDDGRGHGQSLYFGEESGNTREELFELPPSPPEAGFDARFANQGLVLTHPRIIKNVREFPIFLNSFSNQINFSWTVDNERKFTYILIERIGGKTLVETPLLHAGDVALRYDQQTTFALRVQLGIEGAEIPRVYSLGQMYPNPFNPTTHFTITVPFTSQVRIQVFSILGEVVATIVDAVREPGSYALEWTGVQQSGIPVSSGVYYIRMSATAVVHDDRGQGSEFSSSKKIILLR